MNKTVKVNLNKIESVKVFARLASVFDGKLTMRSGIYVIDDKSIMGIYSLDLAHDIELIIESTDSEKVDKFINDIKEFIVD